MKSFCSAFIFSFILFAIPFAAAEEPGRRLTHENLNAVLWVQTSAEYEACARQAFASARESIIRAMNDPDWTAAVEQRVPAALPPTIILDVDETVLDNSPFQAWLAKYQLSFNNSLWKNWVNARLGKAIPGSVELATFAKRNHVAVHFISNREVSLKAATIDNLQQCGFYVKPDGSNVLCTGETGKGESEPWTSDKSGRRSFIARHYRIIALFGDQLSDFISCKNLSPLARKQLANENSEKWGKKWFVVPNPTYGDWERSLLDGDAKLSDAESLRRKFDTFRIWDQAPPTSPTATSGKKPSRP